MDEYIRRGEAIEQFEDSTSAIPEKLARIRIERVPAADVAEVRHGRWIKLSRGDVCPECQYQTGRYEHGGNFCPNCGAKMDGGQEE